MTDRRQITKEDYIESLIDEKEIELSNDKTQLHHVSVHDTEHSQELEMKHIKPDGTDIVNQNVFQQFNPDLPLSESPRIPRVSNSLQIDKTEQL